MDAALNPAYLAAGLGRPTAARLTAWRRQADEVIRQSDELQAVPSDKLVAMARELRWMSKSGTPLDRMLVESFALVREASRRALGMAHYPVQIMGGIAIFHGHIAEMATGEGKTLTATSPTFLRALPGKGVHVITVNDYLADRDAEEMGAVYRLLGMTTGCIQSDMEDDDRRHAYARDITYGTANEMGFDFLRDRLKTGAAPQANPWRRSANLVSGQSEEPVQRGHYFALVDEADSVLIDDAMTPLIIGFPRSNSLAYSSLLKWADSLLPKLARWDDYIYEENRRSAFLTDTGCRRVLFQPKPSWLASFDVERLYVAVEKALVANLAYKLDRDYIIRDQEIVIVDESTGRPMEGRKWQEGLHQAIEAKEQVPITEETVSAATVTVQTFFRNYDFLGGMTGTAWQARRELRKVYRTKVTPIPTNRPCIRKGKPFRVFTNLEKKFEAIRDDLIAMKDDGRAVLVGTPSVRDSEWISSLLREAGIAHEVINARGASREAEIVSQAGQAGRITIATNMAGRGTDIKLTDEVKANGGLHVIATALHTSKRIDRQLVGRSARQGDPGSFQFYLSLQDDLLQHLSDFSVERLNKKLPSMAPKELSRTWLPRFRRAQSKLERLFRKQRKNVLKAEKKRLDNYGRMGLDPYLESAET